MPLSISLLGPFLLRFESGEPVRLRSRKSAEIVALLALSGSRSLHRAQLLANVWPDEEETRSRRNLRTCLAYARKDLRDEGVLSQGSEWVHLRPDVQVDVGQAERYRLRAEMSQIPSERLEALHRLEEILRPRLLEDWTAPWVQLYREQFREQRIRVLVELALAHEEEGRLDASITHAEEALGTEPFSEAALSCLLRCLARLGKVSEASDRYRAFADQLEATLNLEPSAPLRRLASQIRTGRFTLSAPSGASEHRDLAVELFDLALEADPERVLTLLAGKGMSWRAVSKGAEMLPLLDRVLRRTSGWSADRKRVCIDLIVALLYAGRLSDSIEWARVLAQGVPDDSYEAYVAQACELLARIQIDGSVDYDAAFANLIDFAARLDRPYQVAICQGNYAAVLIDACRFEEGEALLARARSAIGEDDSDMGRQARLQIEEIALHARLYQGDYPEAERLGEAIDLQRRVFGIGQVESGGSAAHGYASVRMGTLSGRRRIAEGVTNAYRQRRIIALYSSLDFAAAALAHLGHCDEGLVIAGHASAKRAGAGVLPSRARSEMLSAVFKEPIGSATSCASDLRMVESLWPLLMA